MTSSQWLDLAVLAIAFVAADLRLALRRAGLAAVVHRRGARRSRRGAAGAAHRQPHQRRPTQLFVTLFLILALVVDRRDCRRGVGPGGARRDPQQRPARLRLGHRRGLQVLAVAGGGMICWHPADVVRPAEPGRCGAGLEGAEPGRRGRAGLAAGGAQAAQGAAGHLGPAGCAAAVRPHPDRRRRRARRRAGRRPRGRARAAQRGQDPRRGAGLPKGPGGNRFRGRAQSGDVQRACGRGFGDRDRRGRRRRPTTPPWSPTTRTPTSRSSTCPTCRRRRWPSPRSPPTGTDAVVLGYPGGGDFAATPARVRETIELNGPDIYHTTTVTARCTRSEALCGKVIRAAR